MYKITLVYFICLRVKSFEFPIDMLNVLMSKQSNQNRNPPEKDRVHVIFLF